MGRQAKLALVVLAAIGAAAVLAASGEAGRPAAKLVIGKPVSTPTHALSSKRLSVAFRVTRGAHRVAVRAAKKVTRHGRPLGGKRVKRAPLDFRAGEACRLVRDPGRRDRRRATVKVTVASGGSTALARRDLSDPPRPSSPAHALHRRRVGRRGQQRDERAHVHGHALRPRRAARLGGLRHRRRQRGGARRLHRGERHADVRAGPDDADDHGPGRGRHGESRPTRASPSRSRIR